MTINMMNGDKRSGRLEEKAIMMSEVYEMFSNFLSQFTSKI